MRNFLSVALGIPLGLLLFVWILYLGEPYLILAGDKAKIAIKAIEKQTQQGWGH